MAGWPRHTVHLDFTLPSKEALDAQHERALALVARPLVDDADSEQQPIRIYADLAGHPFCILVG